MALPPLSLLVPAQDPDRNGGWPPGRYAGLVHPAALRCRIMLLSVRCQRCGAGIIRRPGNPISWFGPGSHPPHDKAWHSARPPARRALLPGRVHRHERLPAGAGGPPSLRAAYSFSSSFSSSPEPLVKSLECAGPAAGGCAQALVTACTGTPRLRSQHQGALLHVAWSACVLQPP